MHLTYAHVIAHFAGFCRSTERQWNAVFNLLKIKKKQICSRLGSLDAEVGARWSENAGEHLRTRLSTGLVRHLSVIVINQGLADSCCGAC
jgi:hypothetical protein